MEEKIIVKNVRQTSDVAEKILREYKKYNIFLLKGELGTGKTTLVQLFAKKLGIKQKIQSPTFVLEKKYKICKNLFNKNYNQLVHIDLYRLKKNDAIVQDFSDNFLKDNQYVFIEWPDRLGNTVPKKYLEIHLKYYKKTQRTIIIKTSK